VDRFGVFVDAGYLWAVGLRGANTIPANRWETNLKYAELLDFIKDEASSYARGMELLRVYWYDGAPNCVLTSEHKEIALIRDTKVRLGHLSAQGVQKGVDALLASDLIELTQQGAIQTAVVFSGDGDFVNAVSRAQGYGARVVLFGINDPSVAPELRREVDDCLLFDIDVLARFFEHLPQLGEPDEGREASAVSTPIAPASVAVLANNRPTHEIDNQVVRELGYSFGETFYRQSSSDEISILSLNRPEVPSKLYLAMLNHVLDALELPWGTRLSFSTICAMREGFWHAVAPQVIHCVS
jgi:uncharacterized LabA/DUF88 family protein